jgi:DNA-binding NarL/FixJ family response regulator
VSTRSPSHRLMVCLISRHPGLLTTLERLLGNGPFRVAAVRQESDQSLSAHRGRATDHNLVEPPHASVFVLDGNSLSVLEAEALIERIRTRHPHAKLLVVKESARDDKVFPYLRLGVKGVVRYAEVENDLVNAVKSVASDDYWVQRKQLARFVDWLLSFPLHQGASGMKGPLSRREREVFMSILSGLTNKEIASTLNVSERTVKFHVSHLLQKLGAHRRIDLIAKQHQLWPDAKKIVTLSA